MQKRMYLVLISGLFTCLCAFGTTTTNTEWQVSDGTPGVYCYDATAPLPTQCANPLVGGTVSTTALVGSDIDITEITGEDGGIANGLTLTLLDGELSFVTGANTLDSLGNYTWGSGSFQVTGCVDNGGVCLGTETPTEVLVSGTFSAVSLSGGGDPINEQFVVGGMAGTISESDITSYFGVTPTFVTPPSGAELNAQGVPGGGSFTGSSYSGNTGAGADGDLSIYSTPEGWSLYSSLGLFAFGFVAFKVSRRLGLIRVA